VALMNNHVPMPCNELVELVTAYFERALSDTDTQRFDEHLAECDACRLYLEQLRTTIALAGRIEPERMPPQMQDALGQAFRDWHAGRAHGS
jgi:predicted anti-sigma-YlaC factor YlaD